MSSARAISPGVLLVFEDIFTPARVCAATISSPSCLLLCAHLCTPQPALRNASQVLLPHSILPGAIA